MINERRLRMINNDGNVVRLILNDDVRAYSVATEIANFHMGDTIWCLVLLHNQTGIRMIECNEIFQQ